MTSRFDIPEDHNPADDDTRTRRVACKVCGVDLNDQEAQARPYICADCLDRAQRRAYQSRDYKTLAITIARAS